MCRRSLGRSSLTITPRNDRPVLTITDATPAVDEDVAMYGAFTAELLLDEFSGITTYTDVDVTGTPFLNIW